MHDETATGSGGWLPDGTRASSGGAPRLGFVLLWSQAEPSRVGEWADLPNGDAVLGRDAGGAEPYLRFGQDRPGGAARAPHAPKSPSLSRRQLVLRRAGSGVEVQNVGRAKLLMHGQTFERIDVKPGDVFAVHRELVLMMAARPARGLGGGRRPSFAFGEPDTYGIVGESPSVWMLRDQLEFLASRTEHVLITGPSGSGKELCARAIHAASARAGGPFVARNAVTLPAGLIDAELFGNARNFPNPGMRERAGLIGESERGTLFLDELGELPEDLQAHLLRVLDDGAYHRLGEDRERRADMRLIGATNRPDSKVKHDLAARLKLRLEVPGLDQRREDIPVLARHLLRKLAEHDPKIAARFFEAGEARMDPDLVLSLTRHDYVGNTRELERLLLSAIANSPGNYLAAPAGGRALPARSTNVAEDLSDTEIRDALAQAGGNVSSAWKLLGLSSRDALNRLLKKRGIQPTRE